MSDTYEPVRSLPSVIDKLSDEELDKAKKNAGELIGGDGTVNGIGAVMIVSRQIYAMARQALTRELKREGYEWADGVEEIIIHGMANQAKQPFLRERVVQLVQSHLAPFVIDELQREIEQSKTDELLEQKAEVEKQTKIPVPLPDTDGVFWRRPAMDRGKVITLLGQRQATSQCIQRAIDRLNKLNANPDGMVKFVTIHLMESTQNPNINRKEQLLSLRAGANQWIAAANTYGAFERLMSSLLRVTYKNRCDMLVVDDLQLAFSGGVIGRSSARNVESAFKVIRKWAEKAQCAVIVAAPYPNDEPISEYKQELYELLGSHTDILETEDL